MVKSIKRKVIRITVLLLAVLLVVVLFVHNASSVTIRQYGSEDIRYTEGWQDITETLSEDTPLLEDERLAFYATVTGNIRIQNKRSGRLWSSEQTGEAFEYLEEEKSSLCSVTYFDGQELLTWYSSDQAVDKGQYKVLLSEDGQTVRLEFILGDFNEKLNIPNAVEKERFEKELLPRLEEEDQEYLQRRYTLYHAETVKSEEDADELIANYPDIVNRDYYILSSLSGKITQEKTKKIFDKLGYTAEDAEKDNEESGYAAAQADPLFRIPVDFSLSDSGLEVRVSRDEIAFYSEYPLLELQLLGFFMASEQESDVLVPSGSGALTHYEPGSAAGSYSAPYYGADDTKTSQEIQAIMQSSAGALRLPVTAFITGEEETAAGEIVLCTIGEGAPNASLEIERQVNSIRVSNSFQVVDRDDLYITEKKKMVVCSNSMLSSDLSMTYSFLEQQPDVEPYVTAAAGYRQALIEQQALTPGKNNADPVLMIETVGAIRRTRSLLGLVPFASDEVLTTFEQAGEIADYFSSLNQSCLTLEISGWNSGGLYRQTLGSISVSRGQGGRSGLESLLNSLSSQSIPAFLCVNHAYYYGDSLFDGFSAAKNAAVTMSRDRAQMYLFEPVDHFYTEKSLKTMIISPTQYRAIAARYEAESISRLGIGRLAAVLNSDYDDDIPVDRSAARERVIETLAAYRESGIQLMASQANDYALPYLSLVTDVETASSGDKIFDRDVPFYSLVLHGLVDYVSSPAESNPDEEAVLKVIETGSGLQYTFTMDFGDELYQTEYSRLYYTSFEVNREQALAQAQRVEAALSGLQNQQIVSHRVIGDLTVTGYEDGTLIYVNYSEQAIAYDGVTVPARNYFRRQAS